MSCPPCKYPNSGQQVRLGRRNVLLLGDRFSYSLVHDLASSNYRLAIAGKIVSALAVIYRKVLLVADGGIGR